MTPIYRAFGRYVRDIADGADQAAADVALALIDRGEDAPIPGRNRDGGRGGDVRAFVEDARALPCFDEDDEEQLRELYFGFLGWLHAAPMTRTGIQKAANRGINRDDGDRSVAKSKTRPGKFGDPRARSKRFCSGDHTAGGWGKSMLKADFNGRRASKSRKGGPR